MVPEIMLPSASFATWPETKMKSPARTAGWNGRLGFFFPIGWTSPRRPPASFMALSLVQCRGFDDVDAANAVDEVDQAAIVDGHVVGRRALLAGSRIGQEMADLPGSERIGDVDEAEPLGEPGERDDGAAEAFRRLVAPAHRRLRAAIDVEPGHLEGRDRHRQLLDRDVVDPCEGGCGGPQLGDVLVRHDHDAAPLERLRDRQARGRPWRESRGGD